MQLSHRQSDTQPQYDSYWPHADKTNRFLINDHFHTDCCGTHETDIVGPTNRPFFRRYASVQVAFCKSYRFAIFAQFLRKACVCVSSGRVFCSVCLMRLMEFLFPRLWRQLIVVTTLHDFTSSHKNHVFHERVFFSNQFEVYKNNENN